MSIQDGPVAATVTESDLKVTVERELVSQAEEEDMEALLGTYVLFLALVSGLSFVLDYIIFMHISFSSLTPLLRLRSRTNLFVCWFVAICICSLTSF